VSRSKENLNIIRTPYKTLDKGISRAGYCKEDYEI
jgi:hypothetical protein